MIDDTYRDTEKNHKIRLVTLHIWLPALEILSWDECTVLYREEMVSVSWTTLVFYCFTVFVSHNMYVTLTECWRHLYVRFQEQKVLVWKILAYQIRSVHNKYKDIICKMFWKICHFVSNVILQTRIPFWQYTTAWFSHTTQK